MKRVSLAAMAEVSKCAAFPNDCTFVDGTSVHVSGVGVYDWTAIFGWANYKVIKTPYVGIYGPNFTDNHPCV
jgi:hypothetical protein